MQCVLAPTSGTEVTIRIDEDVDGLTLLYDTRMHTLPRDMYRSTAWSLVRSAALELLLPRGS